MSQIGEEPTMPHSRPPQVCKPAQQVCKPAQRAGWPRWLIRILSAVVVPSLVAAVPARADDAADFYRGKTIHILVGGSSGGAYDTAARMLAMHMGRHLPGAPALVVGNMYGAASLKMANYVYNKAPRDGTVIGVPNSNLLLEPQLKLLSRKGGVVQFDLNRFIWIGTAIQEPQIMWVMRDGPFRGVDDLKRMKAIVGATEAGADNYTLSLVMNRLFGTRLEIVAGYPGPNEVILAAERGEVQGSIGAMSI